MPKVHSTGAEAILCFYFVSAAASDIFLFFAAAAVFLFTDSTRHGTHIYQHNTLTQGA
jgi:hypothetical protein